MNPYLFPPLDLAEWRATRDTLQSYSQVLGKIRRAMTPSRKHWWHTGLRCAANGLRTTPIPAGAQTFDLLLDLTRHQLVLTTNGGERWTSPLRNGSIRSFADDVLARLQWLGIDVPLDRSLFEDETPLLYDPEHAARAWLAFSQVDSLLKRLQGEVRGEASPVQLWPHHFDLSMLWLTGSLVAGQNPHNAEMADEQMNFGFATGDESIPEAYFYATAYPMPGKLIKTALPAPAYWRTEGFTGAVLPYAALVGAHAPDELLMDFLRTTYYAGLALMLDIE